MANIARLLLYVGVLFAIGDVFARWARGDTWAARVPADAQRGPVLAWLAIMTAAVLLFIAQFFALELAPTVTDVGLLVRETTWGRGWMLLAACSLAGMFVTIVRAPLLARAAVALPRVGAFGKRVAGVLDAPQRRGNRGGASHGADGVGQRASSCQQRVAFGGHRQ